MRPVKPFSDAELRYFIEVPRWPRTLTWGIAGMVCVTFAWGPLAYLAWRWWHG